MTEFLNLELLTVTWQQSQPPQIFARINAS
jgi:hypothetical protein